MTNPAPLCFWIKDPSAVGESAAWCEPKAKLLAAVSDQQLSWHTILLESDLRRISMSVSLKPPHKHSGLPMDLGSPRVPAEGVEEHIAEPDGLYKHDQ